MSGGVPIVGETDLIYLEVLGNGKLSGVNFMAALEHIEV